MHCPHSTDDRHMVMLLMPHPQLRSPRGSRKTICTRTVPILRAARPNPPRHSSGERMDSLSLRQLSANQQKVFPRTKRMHTHRAIQQKVCPRLLPIAAQLRALEPALQSVQLTCCPDCFSVVQLSFLAQHRIGCKCTIRQYPECRLQVAMLSGDRRRMFSEWRMSGGTNAG